MKKKIAPPSLVCHGLPENAFQVNQLYNVTWSSVEADLPETIPFSISPNGWAEQFSPNVHSTWDV